MNTGLFGFPSSKLFRYAVITMSTAMPNPPVGDHIEFDGIESGNIKVSNGVGQEKGIITLPPGYLFRLENRLYIADSGTNNIDVVCGWYDYDTNDLLSSIKIRPFGINATAPGSNATDLPASATIIKTTKTLRVVLKLEASSITATGSVSSSSSGTCALIQSIGKLS